jgi:hypothetical protein
MQDNEGRLLTLGRGRTEEDLKVSMSVAQGERTRRCLFED